MYVSKGGRSSPILSSIKDGAYIIHKTFRSNIRIKVWRNPEVLNGGSEKRMQGGLGAHNIRIQGLA